MDRGIYRIDGIVRAAFVLGRKLGTYDIAESTVASAWDGVAPHREAPAETPSPLSLLSPTVLPANPSTPLMLYIGAPPPRTISTALRPPDADVPPAGGKSGENVHTVASPDSI
ncbi:hypothetical protein FA95DRAFT_1614374 [Auriscalpium vulgare]|uniref:Uncharacterized protein n=1 Tax=Auriscalpium vulgare TaxID=40419 RepID=A0ACB8QZJ0_9AGAM|nr:hypothetical protein FA95DRAFT_1614374 [Auriscalpium vulgare]